MARNFLGFFRSFAEAVYYGEGDTDHPDCPRCGDTMEFHGGDRPYGEGYWDCSSCDYSFTEERLNRHLK